MGQPIGGPLNEEADLQQALSLFISHVVLIYNNTTEENVRPAGPAKVNDALWLETRAYEFTPGGFIFTFLPPITALTKL